MGEAGREVGGGGLLHEHGGPSGSVGMGGREMRTAEELKELVRQAVGETLRKKDAVLDQQRLGADLGAESIDRIDLTFRLEEAVGKALEDKILFTEPDPTVAELAERLGRMLEKKE
ncbi:MAG: acyl carrier protein [Verrucomicrobia bacterium]|nr:acyl carrier protein [Verrucomicrobiota bacterium]NBS78554.1 acyl carrier protein [bacterium]NBT24174.1 acyl carrier protein [bacterium]NBV96778.1 acyl carrier protein [Verrucomicrobiota bacterium]NBY66737.1 acyl carrier protein [Verrucomicrobiota bacterium]